MRFFLILSLLIFIPISAQAGDQRPTGTRINLSATAEQAVANDEMIVYYRIQETGSSAQKLQQKVNRLTAKLAARLKSEQLKHKTTGRSLSPHWEKGVLNFQKWSLSQRGQIVTRDLDAISDWLGDIEAMGIKLNNLNFRVSSDKMSKVQDTLRLQALQQFRAKAAILSRGVKAKYFRIIRIQTSGSVPRHYQRGSVMMDSMAMSKAAPVVASGESKATLTLSGEIEVPFTDFPVQ